MPIVLVSCLGESITNVYINAPNSWLIQHFGHDVIMPGTGPSQGWRVREPVIIVLDKLKSLGFRVVAMACHDWRYTWTLDN